MARCVIGALRSIQFIRGTLCADGHPIAGSTVSVIVRETLAVTEKISRAWIESVRRNVRQTKRVMRWQEMKKLID